MAPIHNKTPHQQIAERIATIAYERARILYANEYDRDDKINDALTKAEEAWDQSTSPDKGSYFDDEQTKQDLAEEYTKRELENLSGEATTLGISLDPALMTALITPMSEKTEFQSSSYGC